MVQWLNSVFFRQRGPGWSGNWNPQDATKGSCRQSTKISDALSELGLVKQRPGAAKE